MLFNVSELRKSAVDSFCFRRLFSKKLNMHAKLQIVVASYSFLSFVQNLDICSNNHTSPLIPYSISLYEFGKNFKRNLSISIQNTCHKSWNEEKMWKILIKRQTYGLIICIYIHTHLQVFVIIFQVISYSVWICIALESLKSRTHTVALRCVTA